MESRNIDNNIKDNNIDNKSPIISHNCRIRHPLSGYFSVGDYSIIDDYSYFSTKVKIGRCSHIGSGCSIAGGKKRSFVMGNYSTLSSGVKIYCTGDDFINDTTIIVPNGCSLLKDHLITGDVTMEDYTAIGTNSVVMPGNTIPEGTVIGALSFVPPNFKFVPWAVYAGIPIKFMRLRNKENVIRQIEEVKNYIARK